MFDVRMRSRGFLSLHTYHMVNAVKGRKLWIITEDEVYHVS